MATWADIRSWSHSAIIEAEDPIEEKVREARGIIADLERAVNDIRSQGGGPDRAYQWPAKIQGKLDSCLNKPTEYALAAAELHGYVSRVVAKRKSAWEVAAEVRYDTPESDVVQLSLPGIGFKPVVNRSVELHNCAGDAARITTETEETVGPHHQALADGQYALVGGCHPASVGLAGDANPSWSPEEVSIRWVLLSESERKMSINKDPEKYGNLSGTDTISRAGANELVLDGHLDAVGNCIPGTGPVEKTQNGLDELNQEVERACENGQEASSDLRDKQENLQNRLVDLEAVRDQVQGNAGATLLALEPGELGENVRAVIAIGDVDNAQHVVMPVPETDSDFRGNGGFNVEFMKNLEQVADTCGAPASGSVATTAWIGYEAPPDIVKMWDPSAMSIGKTEAGAEKLSGFVAGIRSRRSERGLDVHQSIIPHSYGSMIMEVMMRDIGEGVVDDLVYTSSPDAGMHSIGTLGVDPEHTWVSATPHLDSVRGRGPDYTFGRSPEHLEGIGHFSGDTSRGEGYKHGIWHRPDADHSSYSHEPGTGNEHNYALEDVGKVIADRKKR